MNKESRCFLLLKPFLKFKEGDVFIQENEDRYYYNVNFHSWHERIHFLTIEDNPEYFKEIDNQ